MNLAFRLSSFFLIYFYFFYFLLIFCQFFCKIFSKSRFFGLSSFFKFIFNFLVASLISLHLCFRIIAIEGPSTREGPMHMKGKFFCQVFFYFIFSGKDRAKFFFVPSFFVSNFFLAKFSCQVFLPSFFVNCIKCFAYLTVARLHTVSSVLHHRQLYLIENFRHKKTPQIWGACFNF